MFETIVAALSFALWGLLMARLFPWAWKLERVAALKAQRKARPARNVVAAEAPVLQRAS